MKTKVYVVTGRSGDYEDTREWEVAIYYSEELASKRMTECQNWVNDLLATPELWNREIYPYEKFYELIETPNPFDENMQMEYSGVNYYYHENEIEDS